jgi:hypothetical protein
MKIKSGVSHMKKLIALIVVLFAAIIYAGFETANYHDEGGSLWVVGGGSQTGTLRIDTTGVFQYEGATANDYETNIAVTDPTADRTITYPDAAGTVSLLSVATYTAGNITAAQCHGTVFVSTAGGDCNLPAVAANMDLTVYLNASVDVNLNPQTGDQILVLTNAAGDAISSAATAGNYVHLRGIDDVNWIRLDSSGTWSDID